MAEYDEAERLLGALSGSMAASPKVGVLTVDRERFRLAADAPIEFGANLPEAVRATVERLRARAETEPEVAGRALHHLYRLVQETETA